MTDEKWAPQYEPWRHGGWYVTNIHYPSGACGCVSRNYADLKWRIVGDPRPFESAPTFRNRDEAARAERDLATMTDAQARTLIDLCTRYRVTFDPNDYRTQFDLPSGYVGGWVGGEPGTIYVGCAPDGAISS